MLDSGARRPVSIKQISFVPYEKVDLDNGLYGEWLLQQLNSFEPGLLSESLEIRKQTVNKIRGKDDVWTKLQGAVYAPLIEDSQNAIRSLRSSLDDCAYLISLKRGGAMLADQIASSQNIQVVKIEKRIMSLEEAERLRTNQTDNYKIQQMADLKACIKSIMNSELQDNLTIAIAESLVGGGSRNLLIRTLEELINENLYPNIKLKIILLQQTIHTEDRGRGIYVSGTTKLSSLQIITAQTRYILGEDVGYQLAKSGDFCKKPVIVFKGSQSRLIAYQINPCESTTARDVIIDLNLGRYNGLLPNVL
ncbi:hypothetical protein NIES4071_34290 [Calothrix sp. NIES-4071]|nr:hypothetical protein NIES4071_34290 [Calothrix sp. NIES-4071]BAZ57748.1 hypothetical protein NIES4105_34220 [Calothrix sp. NIES-4105]